MHDDGTNAETEANRELLGLLKSEELSPEERKKILAIATSMGRPDGSGRRDEAGTRAGKAMFILGALIAAVLLLGAWLLLGRMERGVKKAVPRSDARPATGPGSSSGGLGQPH